MTPDKRRELNRALSAIHAAELGPPPQAFRGLHRPYSKNRFGISGGGVLTAWPLIPEDMPGLCFDRREGRKAACRWCGIAPSAKLGKRTPGHGAAISLARVSSRAKRSYRAAASRLQ